MNDAQRSEFEEKLEVDFSFELHNVGRFRVNAFNQSRGCAACVPYHPKQHSNTGRARSS